MSIVCSSQEWSSIFIIESLNISRATFETIDAINNYADRKFKELDLAPYLEASVKKEKLDGIKNEIYDFIDSLNDEQRNYVVLHLDTLPLDEDLSQ